jgi:hypothetical protein
MGLNSSLIVSLVTAVDGASEFIKGLKLRVKAARDLVVVREVTIAEKDTIIAARDTTIVERNAQNAALLTLADDLRAEVLALGGSLAASEAAYQELLHLKDIAIQERIASEAERVLAVAEATALIAEARALEAAEAEEERLDAIEIGKLQEAIARLAAEATETP